MKNWQILSIGILIGVILSGIAFLRFDSRKSIELTYLSPTVSSNRQINSDTIIVQSRIDINTASISELDTLPGIGEEKAKAIVDFREKNGKFRSVDDLLYVSGIGQSLLDQIKDKIIVH